MRSRRATWKLLCVVAVAVLVAAVNYWWFIKSAPTNHAANRAMELAVQGYEAQNEGRYDEAIAKYDEAIRLNPEFGEAYCNRGVAHMKKRDYDKAHADLTKALQIDPGDSIAAHNLTLVEHARPLADLTQALVEAREAERKITSRRADQLLSEAEQYMSESRFDKAIAAYNECLAIPMWTALLDPKARARAYYSRGLAYQKKGDCDKAIADLSTAIRVSSECINGDPGSRLLQEFRREVYRARANVYKALGDSTNAMLDSEEAEKPLKLQKQQMPSGKMPD